MRALYSVSSGLSEAGGGAPTGRPFRFSHSCWSFFDDFENILSGRVGRKLNAHLFLLRPLRVCGVGLTGHDSLLSVVRL